MKKFKIKKGDNVKVISGNDKGKTGRVLVIEREKDRLIVEGVRMVSKHTKPSADNPNGGIIQKEAPIHVSNVMLMDAAGNATRVGRRLDDNKKLQRYSKKSDELKMHSPRLVDKYKEEIVPALKEKFKYTSVMEVPRLTKIAINRGIGAGVSDKKALETGVDELTTITGQKAVLTIAKKSVSNFKLREEMPIGAKVTLRGAKMYEFLDRLMSVSLPRVRDFRGINDKSFDGRGNYTLGIKEQIIFPEISIDKVTHFNGMDISFVTSANSDEESYELLKAFGMPFKNKK
jgi:large subunit ribosomal protein L5